MRTTCHVNISLHTLHATHVSLNVANMLAILPEIMIASTTLTSLETDEAFSLLIDHHENPHLDPVDTSKDDVSDPITLLLQKHSKPAVPLWEIHLVLRKENKTMSQIPNKRTISEQESNEVKTVVDKRKGTELSSSYVVLFTPSAGDFNSAFSQLLKGFEAVIGSFASLLQDTRILPYVSRSKYDLLMLLEESAAGRTKTQPWPDFHSLLWDCTPYQACVCSIERSLKATMAAAERYSKVNWLTLLCVILCV